MSSSARCAFQKARLHAVLKPRTGHGGGGGPRRQRDPHGSKDGVSGARRTRPILSLTSLTRSQSGKVGKVAQELYSALTDLQSERLPDPSGWLLPVEC